MSRGVKRNPLPATLTKDFLTLPRRWDWRIADAADRKDQISSLLVLHLDELSKSLSSTELL